MTADLDGVTLFAELEAEGLLFSFCSSSHSWSAFRTRLGLHSDSKMGRDVFKSRCYRYPGIQAFSTTRMGNFAVPVGSTWRVLSFAILGKRHVPLQS